METQITLSAPANGSECTVMADCAKTALYKLEYKSKTIGLWHACRDHVVYVINAAMVEALND